MLEPAPPVLDWAFPLPRTHAGVLIGNGTQGLMVWGDEKLCITIGRAGFWDHRGGNLFASRTTYAEVRRLLEARDETGLRKAFASPEQRPGRPGHPFQIGGGRLELAFAGWRLERALLETATATLRLRWSDVCGANAELRIRQAMDAELAWIEWDAALGRPTVALVPSWAHVGGQLAEVGIVPPRAWSAADHGGFIQELPEDVPLALAYALRDRRLTLATALGAEAERRARDLAATADLAPVAARADAWWSTYWRDVPRVRLPDAILQRLWDYGIYKQAGMTTPGGVAATLQGPWMEEFQLPPWSNDYHFNINVQMIYVPCLGTSRLAHLEPMWAMIRSWLPRLRENAADFFGAPAALMLPHAVDDRCAAVGSYWTGMIDHGCTAWMALLAWWHYRHGLEERVLREAAWPLLVGAFDGYWAMLEEIDDGGRRRLSLPVSVSPEYRGAQIDAWGRDASFQLAALHAVAQALPRAAAALGEPADPRWARVRDELPPYTTIAAKGGWNLARDARRIALWAGTDLEESHRHHSHLAALTPFRSIDPAAPEHRDIVHASLEHWTRTGMGTWTGWCLPWAAAIAARADSGDAAVAFLHWMHDGFTNLAGGTLHNADARLISAFGFNPGVTHALREQRHELMQMDAGFGAVGAILELLVQQRGERIVPLPSLPEKWSELEFDGVLCEGAFLVGATARRRRMAEVRVTSQRGGELTIEHGLGERIDVDGRIMAGRVLTLATAAGQRLTLRRAGPA